MIDIYHDYWTVQVRKRVNGRLRWHETNVLTVSEPLARMLAKALVAAGRQARAVLYIPF